MKVENKKITIVLSAIVLIILVSLLIIVNRSNTVGEVAYANVGCCDLICQETSKNDCPNQFNPGVQCNEIPQCNVGCCIDYEGYCYDNYLQSNCQDKGEFKAIGCTNHPKCTTALEQESLIATTGFPILYEGKEFLYSEPLVGKIDSPFLIKALLFENENKNNVEVNITSENYSKQILLFNDGLHGDGNANDMLFSGKWDTSGFPTISSITKVKYEMSNEQENYLLLTPTQCYPITNYVDKDYGLNSQENVIFLNSFTPGNNSLFDFNVMKSYNFLLTKNMNIETLENKSAEEIVGSLLNNNGFNYYSIPLTFDLSTQHTEKLKLKFLEKNCPFLYPKTEQNQTDLTNQTETTTNYIINIGDTIDDCKQVGRFIEINHEFMFNEDSSKQNVTMNNILEDFCKYTMTIDAIQKEAMAKEIPPMIKIIHFDDNGQDVSNVNLSFIIYDNKNESINYTIYADLDHPIMYLHQNTTFNGSKIDLSLNVPDGKHIIQIEAKDSDNNLAISKTLKVEKRVNDFVIQITSLDKIAHPTSPDVTFQIIHKNDDQSIKYEVHDSDSILASGSVKPLVTKTIPTDLTMGPHTIYITAEDNQKNNATSWPYYLEVGNNKEPEMYSAGVEWYEE